MSILVISQLNCLSQTTLLDSTLQFPIVTVTDLTPAQLSCTDVIILIAPTFTQQIQLFEQLQPEQQKLVLFTLTNAQLSEAKSGFLNLNAHPLLATDYLVLPICKQQVALKIQFWQNLGSQPPLKSQYWQQLHQMLDLIPEPIWYKDINFHYQYANQAFTDYTGIALSELVGQTSERVWPEITEFCRTSDQTVAFTHERISATEILTGRNKTGYFNIHKAPMFDNNDNLSNLFGFAKEITDSKNSEATTMRILDSLPFAACIRDLVGNVIYLNAHYKNDYNPDLAVGDNIFDSRFISDNAIHAEIKAEDALVAASKTILSYQKSLDFHGQVRVIQFHKAPIFDVSGNVVQLLMLFQDQTEQINQAERVHRLAFEDSLTGLANRIALYDILNLHQTSTRFGALFTIDIHNFKTFNDRFSHHVGNEMLKVIATRLQTQHPSHFVSRNGNDDFSLFMTFVAPPTHQQLQALATHLLEIVALPVVFEGGTYHVSAKIGIASAMLNTDTPDELISHSELAFQATDFNNPIILYTPALFASLQLRTNVLTAFEQALANEVIELFYQPQYSGTQTLLGFEALFRWPSNPFPQLNVVEIIAIIESSPLIHNLGTYVATKAMKFAKVINENRAVPLTVAINLSAHQVMAPDFVESLQTLQVNLDVPAHFIDLEMTESVLLENIDTNILKFAQLGAIGFHISLDDFGTGYSSLNYLAKLPLSCVKIDRSFICELSHNKQYRTLVRLIIEAAHALNLEVVAEGVETRDELDLLNEWNIDVIQGYYFSKPLPMNDALKLV